MTPIIDPDRNSDFCRSIEAKRIPRRPDVSNAIFGGKRSKVFERREGVQREGDRLFTGARPPPRETTGDAEQSRGIRLIIPRGLYPQSRAAAQCRSVHSDRAGR